MSGISQNKAKMFLECLHLIETQSTFEQLTSLVELLETKLDPEPMEISLVNDIYAFIEKLNVLENNLKQYSSKSRNPLGSKLSKLYEQISYNGNIYSD